MPKTTTETKNFALPQQGASIEDIQSALASYQNQDIQWEEGKTFSLVYGTGNPRITEVAEAAYLQYMHTNALNPNAFESLRLFENEVVKMTASLLGDTGDVAGNMTSGGTESIFLAISTALTYAKKEKGIEQAEMITPITAHPAFDKAAHYLGIKMIHTPIDDEGKADVEAIRAAITPNTILIVGSAPSYPHGIIDPIESLSELAIEKEIPLHVDACVGGFLLPFIQRLGYAIPSFDFRLKGVASISADVHKYGYSPKGASVILYKNKAYRRHQTYVYSGWPGGIYASSTFRGTRSGGAIAAAWSVMKLLGEEGYLDLTRKIMDCRDKFQAFIQNTDGLEIISQPKTSIMAVRSDSFNIYQLGDELALKGWNLDRQQLPPSLHFTFSPIHANLMDELLDDMEQAVRKANRLSWSRVSNQIQVTAVRGLRKIFSEENLQKISKVAAGGPGNLSGRSAAMYGMMGALSGSGTLDELILDFMDKLY